jgi:tetratricopeptide (TPR) repeat protein
MVKFTVFLIIVFLVILSLLAYFNKGTVSLTVWEDVTYEIPVIALILISTAVGIFSMFIVVAVRDARRYIDKWQTQRQQKKEIKIQESYSRGLDAFFASRYEEASELFMRIIEEDPFHINALLRLGDISFNKGDLVKAKDFYTKAREIKPRSIEVLFSLERVFEAQQKWQEALKYLNNILEIDSENPKALYKKREIYEINKNWETLLDVQHEILKSDIPSEEKQKEHKNLVGYKYELGCYYLEKGMTDKAIKILKSIIKTDKDFTGAYLALAEAYLKDGDIEEAEDVLIKGYDTTSSIVLLVRLEDHFIAVGEPGTIINLYQKAIQKDQRDPKLQFFLAKLYYRLEMIDYAFETVNAIDTTAFDYPDLHILLGNIYERRTEYDKAAEEFKKALKVEKPLSVSFCCSNCNYTSKDWIGRCPECKSWNTLTLDLNGICKA